MERDDERKAHIARELLALELLFREGSLSESQREHWRRLTGELVSWLRPAAVDNRQTTRFEGSAKVALHGEDETCDCQLENVSHLGFQLRGTFGSFEPGQQVEVAFQGPAYGTRLACELVWKRDDPVKDQQLAGVRIGAANPPEQQGRFFRQVYYPIYLKLLRDLAARGESGSPPLV